MASISEFAPNRQSPDRSSTSPTILPPPIQRCLEKTNRFDLYDLLFASPGANPARPILMACLNLDARAADFLAATTYWTLASHGPFYKFNAPCEHPWYRLGDSWCEELGWGEETFARARSRVATKNVSGHNLTTTLTSQATTSLVIYWTAEGRVSWYEANLTLLCTKLGEALNIQVYIKKHPARLSPLALASRSKFTDQPPVEPASCTLPTFSPPETSPSATPAPEPALVTTATTPEPTLPPTRSDSVLSRLSRNTKGSRPTYDTLTKEEEAIDPISIPLILYLAQQLTEQGIFDEPAHRIAQRAYQAGLTVDETLNLFKTHLTQLGNTKGSEDAFAIAVWRMLNQPLRPLKRRPQRSPTHERWANELREGTSLPASLGDTATAPPFLPPNDEVYEYQENIPPPRASSPTQSIDHLWQATLADLKLQMARASFDTYLSRSRLVQVEGNHYTINAESNQAAEWLTHRLSRLVQRSLQHQTGTPVSVQFKVYEHQEDNLPPRASSPSHPTFQSIDHLWQAVLADLKLQMARVTFDTYLSRSRLIQVEGNHYTIDAESNQAAEWLTHRFSRLVQRSLQHQTTTPVSVQFVASELSTSHSSQPELAKDTSCPAPDSSFT